MESNKVYCPKCKIKYEKYDLKKNCSNCFACTGCEIYICTVCGERIVITPPKEMKRKK